MEPDKKKQKTESSPSEAVATSTEVSKTAAKKLRNEEHWVRKLVEFKFEAEETKCIKLSGPLKGVMHIPLLQSAQTGKFLPIKGTTKFTVKAKSEDFDDSTLKEITEKTFKRHIGRDYCTKHRSWNSF